MGHTSGVLADAALDPSSTDDSDALRLRWDAVAPHRADLMKVAMRRTACREDAEDAVSAAMLKAVQHRGLDLDRVGPFLCTVVMRLTVDQHRDRTRQLAAGTRWAVREPAPAPIDEGLCDADEARWLRGRLVGCPDREHQFLASRMQGRTTQETVDELGVTRKVVENALTRDRHRARGILAPTLALSLLASVRRLLRPAPAATSAVLVGLVLVTAQGGQQNGPDTAGPRTGTSASPAPAPSPDRSRAAAVRPADASDGADASQPATAPSPPDLHPEAAPAAPERLVVRAPDLVDRKIADPGEVTVSDARGDESFVESLEGCLERLDPLVPTQDPCK